MTDFAMTRTMTGDTIHPFRIKRPGDGGPTRPIGHVLSWDARLAKAATWQPRATHLFWQDLRAAFTPLR